MAKRFVLCSFLTAVMSAGCAVPQPRGGGQYAHVQEPMTKAWYNLYLPVDYVRNGGRHPNNKAGKWPLVMTFHGMKPYDNALPQEREWEKQADIYGYIICAPELNTSDSFMEYPLTKEHSYVLADKRNVLAIMDHIFATTHADPKRVLSTSWSCGGYLAHYFPNRFPDRFSCIATRLSNFSSELLVEESVPLYRDKVPVAIFIGDGDFPACKYESEEAVAWYTARGFRVVRGKMIDHMGHQRIPQTAAAFFAEQLGIEPIHPLDAARTVAEVQMTEYYPSQELLAKLSPKGGAMLAMAPRSENGTLLNARTEAKPQNATATTPPKPAPAFASNTAGKKYPNDRRPSYDPTPANEVKSASTAKQQPQSTPQVASKQPAPDRNKNWLEPPKQPPERRELASAEPSRSTARQGKPAKEEPKRTEPDRMKNAVASAEPTGHSNKTTTPPPSKAAPAKTTQADLRLASADRKQGPSAQFTPQNAGRRDYDRLMEARPRDPAFTPAQAPRTSSATPDTERASVAATPKAKPQRVNVRISGPAIGTAPHYLRYSVDLPRDKTQGADFLWMDNGVWIGDEPKGSKILESPGLHRISVLIVTRDDKEYRGSATVQVLERGSTASSYGTGSHGAAQ